MCMMVYCEAVDIERSGSVDYIFQLLDRLSRASSPVRPDIERGRCIERQAWRNSSRDAIMPNTAFKMYVNYGGRVEFSS
jgi:hypothetical protein